MDEEQDQTGLEPEDDASEPLAVEEAVETFVVVGNHQVHDTEPGDTFTAVPSPHTDYLIAAGHIQQVDESCDAGLPPGAGTGAEPALSDTDVSGEG